MVRHCRHYEMRLSKLNTAFGSIFTITSYQTVLRFETDIEFQSELNRFTDSELVNTTQWVGTAYDKHNLNSANETLSIFEPHQNTNFKTGIIN